jgi:hypothetical protein
MATSVKFRSLCDFGAAFVFSPCPFTNLRAFEVRAFQKGSTPESLFVVGADGDVCFRANQQRILNFPNAVGMFESFKFLLNLIKREGYSRLVVQKKPLPFTGEFSQRVFDEFFPFQWTVIAHYAVAVANFRRVNFKPIPHCAAFKFAFEWFEEFPVDSLRFSPKILWDKIV